MIPLRGALWTLGAALTAFLLFFGYGKYREYNALKDAEQNRKIDSATVVVAHTDTVYDTTRVGYIQYRDRILHSGTATPRDSATFHKADAVVAACDSSKIAHTNLETVLKNKPTGVRRIQAFGEAMFDIAHQVPVIRAGATIAILGPVSLSGAVEYAAPPTTTANPGFRALAGVQVKF